ncbi:MAG: hypothetical protein ABSC55_29180 [Syntrophorhabdales bacterium]
MMLSKEVSAVYQSNRLLPALAAVLLVVCSFQYPSSGVAAQQAAYSASSLRPQQGRYYRWATPPGWLVSETNAGVTLTSPDGIYRASSVTILRSRGTTTPQAFLQWILTHFSTYRNARILSVKNLPNERPSSQGWQFIEAMISYTDNGLPVTSIYKVGVRNYGGLNDAMMVGYRAANANFQGALSFMPQIVKSIVLTNGTEANGNNTLIQPKGHPLANAGQPKGHPLANAGQIKSWKNNQQKAAETQRQRENTITGQVDLYDSSTGETVHSWSQNTNYYWRKPGTNEVVGTNGGNPPGPGYVPLQEQR